MGKGHIVGLMGVILGAIIWLGYGMDWANTVHNFYQNYLLAISPNQLQQAIVSWAFNFLMQPIFVIGQVSVPLVAVAVILVGGTAYFKSSR